MATVEDRLAACEKRATAAEAALSNLNKSAAASSSSSNDAIAKRLTELLALMNEDRKEAEEIRAQRDELKEENGKLRAQVEKLNYRVAHLLKTIVEIEEKK
jgi:hypothetical protein